MSLSARPNASKVAIVAVLAFVVAFPFAAFVAQAPAGRLVLIETRGLDAVGLRSLGLESIVDYNNGIALVRMDPTLIQLPYGVQERGHPYGSRTFLMLGQAGYAFDTEVGVHELRPELTGSGEEFLVQFIGPIRSEWVREAEALGLEFSVYFANYAFAVRGPAGARDGLASLPTVQWVGDYQPAFKISSELRDDSGSVRAFVVGWPSVSTLTLEPLVRQAGGEVIQTMETPSAVEFTADRAVIDVLAQSPLVMRIDEAAEMHTMDSRAGQIHKFHQGWSTARSGLPVTLTGRSPGPDGVIYVGQDDYEGFGIQDTGFDEANQNDGALDFFDGTGDRVIRYAARTGAAGRPDGTCGSAHGTHVVGIAASDGYAWEKYLIEDKGRTDVSLTDKIWDQSEAGVAPEARLSLDGIQSGTAISCGTGVASNANWWDSQYNDGYPTVPCHLNPPNTAGCTFFVTHSNSWGSGPAPYATYANGVDFRIESANERMILFAAGNAGPATNTVSGVSLGKNGLSVGASQNYRPDQFTADNPNNVVDFSGRGPPLGCGTECTGVIKPDIVAVGTAVISNFARGEWDYNAAPMRPGNPQNDFIMEVDKYSYLTLSPGTDGRPDYRYLQGTSMSTPHVAGGYALVREYLREVVSGNNPVSPFFNPPSYAAKALLLNGAVRMDPNLYAYPGPDQGWGRMDLQQSLFPPAPRTNQITIGQFGTSGSCNVGAGTCTGGPSNSVNSALLTNIVGSSVPLKITLVWLDLAGSQAITRNLDVVAVSPGGTVYHGNQYASGWSVENASGFDSVNNVEQIEVQNPQLGPWSFSIVGASVPSTARFAIVVAADIGPTKNYQIDLNTNAPLSYSLAPSGSAVFPFTVTNFGTFDELSPGVGMSSTAPLGLSATFQPGSSFALSSGEADQGYAVITVGSTTPLGVYFFDIRATSGSDPSTNPASDFLTLTIEVVTAPVPSPTRITTESVDELDPSVVVFRDGTIGGHIFIPYRKSTPVVPPDQGGINVWVAHSTIDANGVPGVWSHSPVSSTNDNPNDLRILRIGNGAWSYDNRIVITWTGEDPNAADPDMDSWGRSAYLNPGAGPTYYTGAWTVRTIEANYGSEVIASARVSFPLFRAAGGAGELYWTWEHLDYIAAGAPNPTRVQTHMIRSQDGADSWPTCGAYDYQNVNCIQVFPQDLLDNNFYFFPNGVVDQNDVAWLFVYWRTPTGNDRDLNVRLYDGVSGTGAPLSSLSTRVNVYDTTDNVQWPVALSTAEGTAANRVYFAVTRDQCGTDLKLFTAYADGDYTSAAPPTSTSSPAGTCPTVAANLSPSFAGLAGPLGTSISNANYNRRPILNMVATTSGATITAWLPVMETENPYGQPNLWSWYQDPGFANGVVSKVTADAFAKGHQMSDTLTSNSVGCVYEVYHANKGTAVSVNYDVYLVIYCKGWETAPDLLGPITTEVFTIPEPIDIAAGTFDLLANVNDLATGNNDIVAAEYLIDVMPPVWPGTTMAAVSLFDSPAEAVIATVSTAGLLAGPHDICVRGQDAASNWGGGTCATLFASGSGDPRPLAPTVTGAFVSGGGPAFPDVTIQWNKAADDSMAGGTQEYQILRSTSPTAGFVQIGTVAAVNAPTYTYTCLGCGKGDLSTYFFRVRSFDGTSTTDAVALAAKYTKPVITGKNLISVPLAQNDYSIATVLQTLLSYDSVRTYKNSDTSDPWKAYYPARPGDLTILQLGDPLWVEVNVPDQYVVAGLVVTNPSFTLTPGWNLVGYSSFTPVPQETRAVSLAGFNVARVETYDAAIPGDAYRLKTVAPSTLMVAGEAYWILITSGSGPWVQG